MGAASSSHHPVPGGGGGGPAPAPAAAAGLPPATCPVDHKSMAAASAGAAAAPPRDHHLLHQHRGPVAEKPAPGLPATCPVDHGRAPAAAAAAAPPASAAGGLPSQCPVNHGADSAAASRGGKPASARGTVYNVYAQPIDPTNNMPATANQQPAPGQEVPLSTHRVPSSIPKGGTEDETWQYPSPQMFWNSLVRKGKAEGATETDMEMVVAIHNEMNERTWRHLLEWEHGLHSGCVRGCSGDGLWLRRRRRCGRGSRSWIPRHGAARGCRCLRCAY